MLNTVSTFIRRLCQPRKIIFLRPPHIYIQDYSYSHIGYKGASPWALGHLGCDLQPPPAADGPYRHMDGARGGLRRRSRRGRLRRVLNWAFAICYERARRYSLTLSSQEVPGVESSQPFYSAAQRDNNNISPDLSQSDFFDFLLL